MKKSNYQNLALIITNKCNLDCAHCCRGCKDKKDMSKEVIDKVLSQVAIAGNLAICGGEATLAIPTLEYLVNAIMKNKIIVEELTLTINGTNYSKELLDILSEMNNYIKRYIKKNESSATFTISYDEYHLKEIKRLDILNQYLENIKKYENSIHFYGFQVLKKNKKLYREGNACLLDEKITVPLRPMGYFVTYASNNRKFDMENGLCNIGPLVTINTDGIVTEADSSIDKQNTIYNYGNIFEESIEEIILKKAKVLKPKSWYKSCCRESKKYKNYNK